MTRYNMKKKVFLLIVAISLIMLYINMNFVNAESFEVDNVLIKFLIKQGDSLTKEVKITNIDGIQDFKISSDLEFVEIKDNEFSLNLEESRKIELIFHGNSKYNLDSGVYSGNLIIKGKEEEKVPIILEIESKEVLFDSSISVPLEYSTVEKGGKMIIESRIINLENLGLKTVEIEYFVKDFNGNTIFSDIENIAVETQISVTKTFPIPLNIEEKNYVFGMIIKYENSVGTSSYFFKISEKEEEKSFNYLWIMFGVIFFVVGGLFFYSIKQRNDLFLKLEKQHKEELKLYFGKIKRKETNELKKAKPVEARKIKKKFKKIKKIIKKEVKKKQKKQKKEFKRLGKKKRKSEMQKKLELWKKQGYNTNEFLVKTGKSKEKEVGKKIKDYKKQGYKM